MKRGQRFGKVRLGLLLLALVGALGLIPVILSLPNGEAEPFIPPTLSANAPAASQPDSGNGVVPVEPCFRFFSEVDRQKLAANLKQLDQPFTKQQRPAGMDDDVFAISELMLDDDTALNEQFRLTSEQTGSIVDAGFIKDGEYLVTLADKLVVWRTSTGEKVREHALPITPAQQLLVGSDPATAVIVSDKALVKCSLVDGRLLGQFDISSGIARACLAGQAGSLAVCTGDMQCWLVAADLKSHLVCDTDKLSVPKIAIAANARSVLFFVNQQAMRWIPETGTIENLPTKSLKIETASVVAGKDYDHIVDGFSFYVYDENGRVMPIPENNSALPYYFNSVVSQVLPTESDFDDSLLVIARERPSQPPALRVMDAIPTFYAGSKDATVSQHTDARVFANRVGDCLAILDADGMRVVRRRRWVSNDGKMFAQFMRKVFLSGRFDQLDLLGTYIRQHKRLPCNETGEEIFTALAKTLGSMWEIIERDDHRQLLRQQADKWKSSRSVLAVAASAQRHLQIGTKARGGGFANTVTPEGWQIFNERQQQAMTELTSLPKDEVWPAFLYELLIEVLKDTGGSFEQGDSLLREYTDNYPFETAGHAVACAWSLPRWAGEPGQSGAYLTALASLYPPEFSEVMYTRVAMVFKSDQTEITQGEFGINEQRVWQALDALTNRVWLSRPDMERAMRNAHLSELMYRLSKLVNRYLREHDVVGHEVYTNTGLTVLANLRSAAYRVTAEPR